MTRTNFRHALMMTLCLLAFTGPVSVARAVQPPQPGPGPWENDVHVYRVGRDGAVAKLAAFDRAGVATLTRLKDGRLIAAHQNFPDTPADFDRVAVRFSSDEGRTWTPAQTIRLTGLPKGMRFPFDPTLAALPDGRVRLYFTSVRGRRIDLQMPAIYSAISDNGIDYTVEPGTRFAVTGRVVIDCAVALHRGVFHLYVPDNVAGGRPGREGLGYYATSTDGLRFTRQDAAKIAGRRRWLGCAVSDGDVLRFFGTGDSGIWTATSATGKEWKPDTSFPPIPGADPGAVRLRDGGWLFVVTGPRGQ
jgi:hypothetical protein